MPRLKKYTTKDGFIFDNNKVMNPDEVIERLNAYHISELISDRQADCGCTGGMCPHCQEYLKELTGEN